MTGSNRWTENPINKVYFDNLIIARPYIDPADLRSLSGALDSSGLRSVRWIG